MDRKLLIGFTLAAISFSNVSNAGFTFYSDAPSICESISGQWNGVGSASSWLISCNYHGIGNIGSVDVNGGFTMSVVAEKDSGSFLCPQHTEVQFNGSCVNGVLSIPTGFGDIVGHFSKNTGDGQGTLSFAPGMSVDVTMQLTRVE